MKVIGPLLLVSFLFLMAVVGAGWSALHFLLGVIIPYTAFLLLLAGMIWRVVDWAATPVPFRIPTTTGQQKSLDWIRHDPLESPSNTLEVVARMAMEILFFRSLFRNTRGEMNPDQKRLVFGPTKWLWLGGMLFHWSLLVVLIRHLRLFAEPVPLLTSWIMALDGFFEFGVPVLYLSSLSLLAALVFLFLRRIGLPRMRYLSLANDYFPLFLLLGIAGSGLVLRHWVKIDITEVKTYALSLISLQPQIPEDPHWLFFGHLLLVSILVAYIPFSKLSHMGGVFLSPTRNLANNNRRRRHRNPWNHPVSVHTYEEYEEEFRDKMEKADIPVERKG